MCWPFLVNRLPADVAALVHSVALLGLSPLVHQSWS
jgi:hypothetical protein